MRSMLFKRDFAFRSLDDAHDILAMQEDRKAGENDDRDFHEILVRQCDRQGGANDHAENGADGYHTADRDRYETDHYRDERWCCHQHKEYAECRGYTLASAELIVDRITMTEDH